MEVKESGPVQISEQDERKYRHITLPNKMQASTNTHTTQTPLTERAWSFCRVSVVFGLLL